VQDLDVEQPRDEQTLLALAQVFGKAARQLVEDPAPEQREEDQEQQAARARQRIAQVMADQYPDMPASTHDCHGIGVCSSFLLGR
jgi:hypothetical protein